MIYYYVCQKCEQITETEESIVDHQVGVPGPECECGGETKQKITGSPMFRLNWTDPHK